MLMIAVPGSEEFEQRRALKLVVGNQGLAERLT
jgi:hypothetical protein